MADHQFESITASAAGAYLAAADSLTFAGGEASMVTVQYLADQVMLTLGGRSVGFGLGLMGETASFANGARLFVGGTGADTASGTSQADGLYGGQGEDSLAGGAGGDLLQGNQGGDTLDGGADADIIYGGQGDDRILVGEGANFAQGNLGSDTISASPSAGRNTLLGGQGNDLISGGGDADFLNGNLGDDSLVGGAGQDTLAGEGGADVFVFGSGSSDAGPLGVFVGEIVDRIVGWTAADRIDKPGGALPPPGVPGVDPSHYYELSPATNEADADYYGPFGPPLPYDYWRARDECFRLMTDNPTLDVIVVESDNDVLVFIDADGGNAPDLAIRLVGVGLGDIGFGNFI